MKILLLSTYEKTGGAAIAAQRLLKALNANGVEATMLCRRNLSWWRGKPQSWSSIWERAVVFCNTLSRKGLWSVDIANCGQDVTKTREFREADVIHLHWVSQGFLSLRTIEKIVRSGRRVVWTMHDEWALDTIYHYTYGTEDQQCRMARRVFEQKHAIYSLGRITFVTCSKWLRDISRRKPLAEGQEVVAIPNCIDANLFRPIPHERRKRILFVAQNVNDVRKGMRYLEQVERMFKEQEGGAKYEFIALGRDIPYISDVRKMAELYASMDLFVTPSLQDNLPNTIMEAMACGIPCVGFNVGGIPEMIDHKVNGYVARYEDAEDLAQGIRYALDEENHGRLAEAAREKVLRCYSEEAVAQQYIDCYKS